jgi:4-hydroxy-tetrahydrodipicolinate synthase
MSKTLYGTVPIIPTPFHEDETIDEDSLRSLIDFAVASGIKAVCLPAYASEFYKLTDEERLFVVRIAVQHSFVLFRTHEFWFRTSILVEALLV